VTGLSTMAGGPATNAVAIESQPRRMMDAVNAINERLESLDRSVGFLMDRLGPALLPDCPRAIPSSGEEKQPDESRYVTDLSAIAYRIQGIECVLRNLADRVQT